MLLFPCEILVWRRPQNSHLHSWAFVLPDVMSMLRVHMGHWEPKPRRGDTPPICKGADHLILPFPSSLCGHVCCPDSAHLSPNLPPPAPSSLASLTTLATWTGWQMPASLHFGLPKWSASLPSTPDSNLTPVCPVLLGT